MKAQGKESQGGAPDNRVITTGLNLNSFLVILSPNHSLAILLKAYLCCQFVKKMQKRHEKADK